MGKHWPVSRCPTHILILSLRETSPRCSGHFAGPCAQRTRLGAEPSHGDDGCALILAGVPWSTLPKAWLPPLSSSHNQHLQEREMEKPGASSPVVCGPQPLLRGQGDSSSFHWHPVVGFLHREMPRSRLGKLWRTLPPPCRAAEP